MGIESVHTVTLFYCYAHEDELLREELEKHLAALKRLGHITSWHDRQIQAGTEWQQEIEAHLSSANLILLLISPDFIHSDACDGEMRKALELHHANCARVIPILLRSVVWESTPLADLQLLPRDGKPITTWHNRDEAFRQVAHSIGNIVRSFLALPPYPSFIIPTQAAEEALEPSFTRTLPSPTCEPSFGPRNPYKGLRSFTLEDAADFFGRERLITELVTALQKRLSSPQHEHGSRLLTVVGPSGSGKSSAVMAGFLPALQKGALPGSERWIYLEPVIPGTHPLEALACSLSYRFPQRSLASLQEDLCVPSARGLHLLTTALTIEEGPFVLLYIDQFEELFTQTLEEAERTQFIDLLVTAITEPQGALIAVFSLRADFYDRPMRFPALFRLMQVAQVAVLPLDHHDLRDVIKKPAALPDVRLRFEDDLVGELLAEMKGQRGALPLLQFTLDGLFQRRQGQWLMLSAYHEMGGVQGALARHAEATYASLPTAKHRNLTRALFLLLVEPGAFDQDPTRRRVALSELVLIDSSKAVILQEVAAIFTSARLLTTTMQDGVAVVEVSHEAVIRGWTRLTKWLHEAHEDLYLQKRVREDAAAWIRHGYLVERLYRDDQLEEALDWEQRSLLSQNEKAFLQASTDEQAEQTLWHRKRYRRRIVLAGLTGLGLAVAAVTVGFELFPKPSRPPSSLFLSYSCQGHTDVVYSVTWSPDGKQLASASKDETVRVWDASGGANFSIYVGHTGSLEDAAWSPDGKLVASASSDKTIRVWDANSGHALHTYIGHTDSVNSVAWSSDGKLIASASSDKTIRVWDANSGHALRTYTGHTDGVNSVAWSPDSSRLASASSDKTVRIWDANSGHALHTYIGHTDAVNSVAWSPDGKLIASASDDKTVRLWDANNGSRVVTYTRHTDRVYSVVWSPDGKRLASAGDDVHVWEASNGRTLLIYTGQPAEVRSVAWSPDGKHLASASGDSTVQVWDAKDGHSLYTYTGLISTLHSVAWSPDGTRLAVTGADNTVFVWDSGVNIGRTLLTYTGHRGPVYCVAWSPDGTRLASVGYDNTVQVWDAVNGHLLITYKGHIGKVSRVAWSPDGKRLVSYGDEVRIWAASDGHTLYAYTGLPYGVDSVAWSPDGKRLALTSSHQKNGSNEIESVVEVRDASNGHIFFTYTAQPQVVRVAWSPDGKYLASASFSGSVQVWDANNGRTLVNAFTGVGGFTNCIAWSPDGKSLASGRSDSTIFILDANNGDILNTSAGQGGSVNSVAWAPDGNRIASASADRMVRVWLFPPF